MSGAGVEQMFASLLSLGATGLASGSRLGSEELSADRKKEQEKQDVSMFFDKNKFKNRWC